jgi:hypothetical protein
VSEPGWEQADPYPGEDPPAVAAQAGLAVATASVIPEQESDKENED